MEISLGDDRLPVSEHTEVVRARSASDHEPLELAHRDRARVIEPSPLLDRAGLEDAFRRLGDHLARRVMLADLYVLDGVAMALAYDSCRATRNVDAPFKPHDTVYEEALAIASEFGVLQHEAAGSPADHNKTLAKASFPVIWRALAVRRPIRRRAP